MEKLILKAIELIGLIAVLVFLISNITVENWDKYQNRVSPSVLKIGQEVGQEVGRNKNKRIKEIKNKRRLTRQEEIFIILREV